MRRIAVLATGTDIGKTHVSAQLLGHLRGRSLKVSACKPLMSGFSGSELADSDAGRLLVASGLEPSTEAVDRICLHRFEEALAPNVAARRSALLLDDQKILAFCRERLAADSDFVLLEGAGGVLSPLSDSLLNVDLIRQLELPAVLVSANYLGTVSHTLSALEVCKARGVEISAVAISQPTPDFGAPAETAEELSRWTDVPCTPVPFSPIDRPGDDIARLADLIAV